MALFRRRSRPGRPAPPVVPGWFTVDGVDHLVASELHAGAEHRWEYRPAGEGGGAGEAGGAVRSRVRLDLQPGTTPPGEAAYAVLVEANARHLAPGDMTHGVRRDPASDELTADFLRCGSDGSDGAETWEWDVRRIVRRPGGLLVLAWNLSARGGAADALVARVGAEREELVANLRAVALPDVAGWD